MDAKTTKELVTILEEEFDRSMKIQRECSPLRGPGAENPDYGKILDFNHKNSLDALECFWSIREQIQQYQIKHSVSGIVWREWTYRGKTISCPELHYQLVAVPGDKKILTANSLAVFQWWIEVTQSLELWKSTNEVDKPTTLSEILETKSKSEWIRTYILDSRNQWEIYLVLEWGELENMSEGIAFYGLTPELKPTALEKLISNQ